VTPAELVECDVPGRGLYAGHLGRWLDKQRHLHAIGKLLPQREQLLQALVDEGLLSETVISN
jgi:hypothetical protein